MQRDFTIRKYLELCNAVKEGYTVVTVADYILEQPQRCVILRHDIDISANKALGIAKLEKDVGVSSTYYFRMIPGIFKPDIIEDIQSMGHEIGYHYEVLDKTKGNKKRAIRLFEKELEKFRKICDIKTIAMHGNPYTPWINCSLWDDIDFRDYGIIGEAYLSLDYSKIPYFTDTSRTWDGRYNIKDLVRIKNPYSRELGCTDDLIRIIQTKKLRSICINTHPKRWNDSFLPWLWELGSQSTKNLFKLCLKCNRQ
ncbi:MAG: hypothetical protein JW778_01970 [Candidatus Altiarchaeota archaeon]|nr:hypothetical protein [Candidatus Altiarchaeota archaeon]